MRRRTFQLLTSVMLVTFILFVCLELIGCGQKEKGKKAKPLVGQQEQKSETSAADSAASVPHETTPVEQDKSESDVVTQVAADSARSNNPDLPELRVVEVKIINEGWARVVLEPVDKSTDAATWYMKKESGKWTVFDFGTAIVPENHPEAPAELFR